MTLPPDAFLIQRIAALGDRAALAELDARHGMTLYAVAYSLTLDPNAADAAVSAAFREVWRSAASFIAGEASVQRWLTGLTRRVAVSGVGCLVSGGAGFGHPTPDT